MDDQVGLMVHPWGPGWALKSHSQAINVVECLGFKALLVYLCDSLTIKELPGQTLVWKMIIQMWHAEFKNLKWEVAVRIL
jgi:hypothetical protein